MLSGTSIKVKVGEGREGLGEVAAEMGQIP